MREPETRARISEALRPGNSSIDDVRNAPVVILACAQLCRSGFIEGEVMTGKEDCFMFDVALAMQNLALATHELGPGTVHVGWFDEQKVKENLQIPEGVVEVELTQLGYPD